MASVDEQLTPVRRVVTSLDSKGGAFVQIDGAVRLTNAPDGTGAQFGIAWQTQSSPADVQVEGDSAELPTGELTNAGELPQFTSVRLVAD